MLTDKDIQKLDKYFATKQDLESFVHKGEFYEFKTNLFDILDGVVRSIEELKMEIASIKIQLDRHERWTKEIARKLDIVLTY